MHSGLHHTFGPFRLQPAERLLLLDDQPVRLGSRAFDILCVLVDHAGQILSNGELLRHVWGGTVVDEGSVRVHVAALRKALGADGARGDYIANVPMRGYGFVAQVVTHAPAAAVSSASGTGQRQASALVPIGAVEKLPVPPRLVGRDATVQAVCDTLEKRRHVTVVGPGGIGKTSLALAVARQVAPRFAQGVHLVDLSSLADARVVPSALAAALGVPVVDEDALEGVITKLQSSEKLILLDNCEHVIEAAASMVEKLLRRVGGVKVLATSREALRSDGEWVHRLSGLHKPWQQQPASLKDALQYPAVRLLVDRVEESVSDFSVTDADLGAVVDICRATDGIPLAIELAATQVSTFGMRHLADLLTDRMSILIQGRRTALARHRTLRATLDWSYELLDDKEQAVLRRLSMFRGPFSLQAAISISQCSQINASAAGDRLVNLVNKSLVSLDNLHGREAPSYRLLETTRGYAAQRLSDSGEAAWMARRHAQVVHATLSAPGEGGSPVNLDDVRAALDWALSSVGDEAFGLELTVASTPLWFRLGLIKEFRDRLERAESLRQRLPEQEDRDLQLALALGHVHLHTLGPNTVGEHAFRRALDLLSRIDSPAAKLGAFWSLYTDRMVRGDYDGTLAFSRAFGEIAARQSDEQPRLTYHRMMAMSLHMRGEHAAALEHGHSAMQVPMASVPHLHGSAFRVDHRAATMAGMARTLWILGRVDDAVQMAVDGAERAIAVDPAFSPTYTLVMGTCPVMLWVGDAEGAGRYAAMLRDAVSRHTLEFWQVWSQMYDAVLSWWPTQDPHDLAWVPRFAASAGRADLLGTLSISLLNDNALQRASAGLNGWCGVELRRAAIERDWRSGVLVAEQVGPRLEACIAAARAQDALSWELRATSTLAQWLAARERRPEAVARLEGILSRFRQGLSTRDLRRAIALLETLRV